MASISSFTITQDHILNPRSYNANDVLEENRLVFGEDDNGRIICPISCEELKEGQTVYKVDCCKTVFSKEGLTGYLKQDSSCPICKKTLDLPDDSLTDKVHKGLRRTITVTILVIAAGGIVIGGALAVKAIIIDEEPVIEKLKAMVMGAGMVASSVFLGIAAFYFESLRR